MIRRMKRRERRSSELNLISLMDMFTILVIFLLFQATEDGSERSIAKDVILPVSTSSQEPRPALTVTVTTKEISVEERVVADSLKALDDPAPIIAALKEEIAGRRIEKVNLLGDRSISFDLLKKVMLTCTESGVRDISLAVLSREAP